MSPPDEPTGSTYTLEEITAILPTGSDASSYSAELQDAASVDELGNHRYAFRFYMRNRREKFGLSIRQAAKDSGISEARWRQLESGYQSIRGEKIAIKTTQETVLRIARTMHMDPEVALASAGFSPALAHIPDTGNWQPQDEEPSRRGLAALIPPEEHWRTLDPERLAKDILERLPFLAIAELDRVAREAMAVRRAKAVEALKAVDLLDPFQLPSALSRKVADVHAREQLRMLASKYRRATEEVLELQERATAARRTWIHASSPENKALLAKEESARDTAVREAKALFHAYVTVLVEAKVGPELIEVTHDGGLEAKQQDTEVNE